VVVLAARARALAGDLVRGFEAHDLLTYASAISFQILTAIIPFLLFVLAVTSLFDPGVWHDHLEPQVRANVSASMLAVIQSAVGKVLTGRRIVWATLGGGLALWQISGAVRAVMGALGRIYESPVRRPFVRRYSISFVLSIELGICFTLTAACLLFAPFFWSLHSGWFPNLSGLLIRWLLATATLVLVVGLLVRHAPACAQPTPWVSLGAGIVIALWLVVSFTFYFYLTDIASYQSVFGNLAAVIVAMAYLYVSTTVFLFGAQLDAIIRARTTGSAAGTGEP
jgi:membrane protein